jgi:hypothetical protein
MWMISGLVCQETSQVLSLEREESKILKELDPLQTHTCCASSGQPHLGKASESLTFQCFINLPTLHITDKCLDTKMALLLGTEQAAALIHSQSIEDTADVPDCLSWPSAPLRH